MEENKIPQIALKYFIKPGDKQGEYKNGDNCTPAFLPMVKREQYAGN